MADRPCNPPDELQPQAIDPFDNESPTVFTDHNAASKDWRQGDSVTVDLRFIADIDLWQREKPFCLNLPLPKGQPKSNFISENHEARICNIRGRESEFSLDRHGFAFLKMPPFTVSFDKTAEIEEIYIPEMQDFLQKTLNADEVFIFDYTRRRCLREKSDYEGSFYRPPGTVAHIDQTPNAARQRLRLHFGENGEKKVKGRMQLINLWRPTFGPVQDCPMAVCDSRALQKDELVLSDLVYPHYVGEKIDIKWSAKHKWYYLRNMGDDECLLIKNFDTALDGRSRCCAHCAFIDLTAPNNARPRESIEVRAMVFYN